MTATLGGFQAFIQTVMGVNAAALNINDPSVANSFQYAQNIVLPDLQCVPPVVPSPTVYDMAIYSLAADTLVNWAPDGTGTNAQSTTFATLRTKYGINTFVGGVISWSSDVNTSESLLVPDQMKGLNFLDLQALKTPWGRQYLSLAGAWGGVIGIS